MAGGKEEADGRNELYEADQPKLKRAAGQFIHLPTDRDRLYLQRDGSGDAHIKKAKICGLSKQGDRRGDFGAHRQRS